MASSAREADERRRGKTEGDDIFSEREGIDVRLTLMTDYALRLLMYVAQHPDRLCTIAEVAGAYGISEAHMMKITHQLGAAGWIETLRGKGGGMRLACPPEGINLGSVVRGMEPDFHLAECFATGGGCSLTGNCQLTGVVNHALKGFLERLDARTLADILPPEKLANPKVTFMPRRARARAA